MKMSSILLRLSLVVGVLYAELGIGDGECSPSSSGFRVFYGKDEEYLAKLSQSELLQFAAKSGESHVVTLSRSSHVGLTQEGANINIDCSLWLANQFPTTRGNKTIQWYFLQLDDSGNITDPNRVPVNPTEEISRVIVGGKSNRWLNISRITAIQGAEDPDYKIFMCEVCEMFDVGGTVFKRCHVSNYTSRVIGAPPVLTINSRNSSFCVARNVDRVLNLMCDVRNDPSNPPIPLPTPTRSWFKDGNLIYSAQLSAFLDASGFLMNNTILALGVLTPMILTLQQDGQIWYNTRVDNITQPGMIPEVTTIDQARELVFDLSLGMWTCAVNNMFGTAAVEYLIRECDNSTSEFDRPVFGWLQNSYTGREQNASHTLNVGVIKGAENLMQSFTFRVNTSEKSGDFTVHTTLVELSPPFTSPTTVEVTFHEDGVALEGNETFQLHLVPITPFNHSGVDFRDSVALSIQDSDVVDVSLSRSQYPVNESEGRVIVQVLKNKKIANPLSLGVSTWTLGEAESKGCLPLIDFQVDTGIITRDMAEVNNDFNPTSYFTDVFSFLPDEGESPVNHINVTIPIIDDKLAEHPESFVVTLELRAQYGSGVRIVQHSSFINISGSDGCQEEYLYLPGIGNYTYPLTTLEHEQLIQCPGVPGITVTRVCGENGQWMEPDYLSCSVAILEQNRNNIQNLLDKISVGREEAEDLFGNLTDTVRLAEETGMGQTEEILEVIDEAFATVGSSAIDAASEEVVMDAVRLLDKLSDWPEDLVQQKSSNIVRSFEAIAMNLADQVDFTNLSTIGEDILLRAERRDVKQLTATGVPVKFNINEGVKSVNQLSAPSLSDDDISSITLPPSLFEALQMEGSYEDVGLIFTSYLDATLFPLTVSDPNSSTFVGSSVIGATVVSNEPVRDLSEPIVMVFRVDNFTNADFVQCVSWDFEEIGGRGNWSASGCQTVKSDKNMVECHCNHLTNFALLVDICFRTGGCEERNETFSLILNISSLIGVIISISCLAVTIVTLIGLLVMKLRSSKERERQTAVQYKFYIQLCIALLCMYVVFIVGFERKDNYGGCVAVSVLIHYFTLASVMWMSATCMFIFWIMVVNPFAKSKFNSCHMLFITLLCWGVPVIPVIIPVAVNRDLVVTYSNEDPSKLQYCFIKNEVVFFAAFLGPIFLLIVMNVVMFIGITFVQLRYICCTRRRRIQEDKNGHTKNKLCENFVIVLKLWCILSLFGLTWLFGAFTVTQSALYVFSTLFVVFSSLQGFFIFVFLCILSKDTLKCYRSIFCRWNKSFESPESPSLATKSTSLATKDGDHIYKPIYDDATKYALAQELSTKVKLYEPEPDVIETSTFKPV